MRKIGPAARYTLLQIPGLMFLGGLLWSAYERGWLGLDLVGWILAIWIAKDALLYPFYRPALRGPAPTGGNALVGRRGVVRQALDPEGLVFIGGEHWRARSSDGRALAPGTTVRVVAARGLLLTVESFEESGSS